MPTSSRTSSVSVAETADRVAVTVTCSEWKTAAKLPLSWSDQMKIAGLFLSLALFLATPAIASDLPNPLAPEAATIEGTSSAGEDWTFTLAPYFWMAGISGDVAQFHGPTIHIDRSFQDIFADFDIGGMALAELRHGKFSLLGDVIYTEITSSDATPRGVFARDVDVTSKTFTGFLGAGYTLAEGPAGHLDLAGGARLWSVKAEAEISGGRFDGRSFSDSATWVDGMVGVRGGYSFTPNFFLTGWAFVGAGGADLGWDVAATLGYRINGTFSALAGYRGLGVDYEKNDFAYDVVQHGPIIGLSLHF